jgi:hypothetical protein
LVAVASCGNGEAPVREQASSCLVEKLNVFFSKAANGDVLLPTGQCLPHAMTTNPLNQVPCLVLEARTVQSDCECSGGRSPVAPASSALVDIALEDPQAASEGWNCFCTLDQLSGFAADACRQQPEPPSNVAGWCYVDESIGNPELVAKCAETEQHMTRFVGGVPAPGSTVFVVCCDG